MRLLVFGLSITSSWGNGHATVYRGLLKALSRADVQVTFVEKDVPWYASNRDLAQCDFASVLLYQDTSQLSDLLAKEAVRADVVMVGSYFPDGIEVTSRLAGQPDLIRIYYDIDTPVTIASFKASGAAPYLRADQLQVFDTVLSFTGGRALSELEERWGARRAIAFYCALDPEVHSRTEPSEALRCRLSYMGTYSADRHAAWESLFLRPAMGLPQRRFVLAGPQYPETELPPNVLHIQHLPPAEHSAFYSSCDLTLNITRGPMVAYGYSPSIRLFEAAGCATCVVSDRWDGMGDVFDVGRELLVAADEKEMVDLLERMDPDEARLIGERARQRALRDHTYEARAKQFLELLASL